MRAIRGRRYSNVTAVTESDVLSAGSKSLAMSGFLVPRESTRRSRGGEVREKIGPAPAPPVLDCTVPRKLDCMPWRRASKRCRRRCRLGLLLSPTLRDDADAAKAAARSCALAAQCCAAPPPCTAPVLDDGRPEPALAARPDAHRHPRRKRDGLPAVPAHRRRHGPARGRPPQLHRPRRRAVRLSRSRSSSSPVGPHRAAVH